MNGGLVLAGGTGERLKDLGVPKQFFEINKVPMLVYCLKTFQLCDVITMIVIVGPEEWHEQILQWTKHYEISKFTLFAPPGNTRQNSIYNGLRTMQETFEGIDFVIVHDAARPMMTIQDIKDSVRFANNYDGATPIIPMSDTIYQSSNGKEITALLNRDELFAGQTPECYRFDKYLKAHERLSDEEIGSARGSSEIAFSAGMKIRLFPGNVANFKISTLSDLKYLKYIIEKD